MNQEEVLELREEELCDLSHATARYLAASPLKKSTWLQPPARNGIRSRRQSRLCTSPLR